MFTIDPDYSTTAFIADPGGVIDYANETQNLFEFVDDNDDQDRFTDWQRYRQSQGLGGEGGSVGRDTEIFPGLDENNDFISDFNQNQNSRPDYVEPFPPLSGRSAGVSLWHGHEQQHDRRPL